MAKNAKIKFLHLIGATCIGKGWLTEMASDYLEKKHGRKTGVIRMGDAVRDRLKNDQEFHAKYARIIEKGGLVDDVDAIPMFNKLLPGAIAVGAFCIDDGFCRTPKQVEHAAANGLLKENDVAIILHGSKSICRDRALDRIRRKGSGHRLDEGAFDYRFDLHREAAPRLQAALQRTKATIIQMDANGHLKDDVFPNIVTIIESQLSAQFQQTEHHPMQAAFAQQAARWKAGTMPEVAASPLTRQMVATTM